MTPASPSRAGAPGPRGGTAPDRAPARLPGGPVGAAARLAGGSLAVHALALTGDPVARLFTAGPGSDVYAVHERIRAAGPLTRSRLGAVAVTSHDLCRQVLRDPRFVTRSPDGSVPGLDPVTDWANPFLRDTFLTRDPPDHTRLRRLVSPAFRPALLRQYAGRVEAVADRLVDELSGDLAEGPADVVARVAVPLPVTVIRDLLGVPDTDTERFGQVGKVVGQGLDGVRSLRQARQLRAATDWLRALFERLARERRADPRDDVVSGLVAAEEAGTVTADELLATCVLLLVAGFETTTNLVGNATAAVLARPGLWRRLATEPALAAAVVTETLRWDTPVQATLRVAGEPVELAGHVLPRGTSVLVDLAAANRDPDVYAEPARFDPDRSRDRDEPEHLAFASGIHYCLGAPLARIEGEVALRVLAARLPGLQAAPGARRRRGMTLRGYERLPVTAR